MLKFFAKYQKIMLVVGGSVLMVVFLLPNVQMFLPDPAAEAIGYVREEEITGHDQQRAAATLALLEAAQRRLGQHVQANPRQARLPPLSEFLIRSPLPDDPLQWLLIQQEAKDHGVYVSGSEGQEMLIEMSRAGVDIRPLLAEGGEETVARALADWQAYVKYTDLMFGVGLPSEPRLRHLARDVRSRASVKFVPIDPTKAVTDLPEPTEQQLTEHFEKYKGKRLDASNPDGYGYLLPPRVKLEYIAVPLKRVALSVTMDEVDAVEYYKENPGQFRPPPPQPAKPQEPAVLDLPDGKSSAEDPTPPAEATPAAPEAEDGEPEDPACENEPSPQSDGEPAPATDAPSAPAPAVPPQEVPRDPNVPLPYIEVRQRIIDQLTDQRAAAKQAQIMQFIQTELNKDTTRLPVNPKGYRDLPKEHQPASLEDLAKRVQERFGVLPDVVRIDNRWLSLEDVAELEGFGDAALELSGQRVPVTAYLASTRELGLVENAGPLAALRLQEGVAARTVNDGGGTGYVFRVIDAEPEREPKSLDEVRERVARDVHEKLAYEALKARSDAILEQARTEGLEAVAKQYGAEVHEAGPFSAYDEYAIQLMGRTEPPTLPVIGQSEEFVDAVFDAANEVVAAGGVDSAGPAQTITAIPLDRTRKLCVTQLTAYEPIDSEAYERERGFLARYVFGSELREMPGGESPLTLEALKERTGFVSAYPEKEDGRDGKDGTEEPQDTDPGDKS